MLVDPGMTQTHVIGDKVEHKFQAALTESFTKSSQRCAAPEVLIHGIAGDCETGTGNVLLA